MVAMGKTQESQDKDFGYPGDRIVNHFLVLNSQHTQGWLKNKPKLMPQHYLEEA